MATNPYRNVSTRLTPQRERSLDRNDEVQNSEGAYVFETDPMARLDRFLILGTESPTYYSSAEKLTKESAKFLIALANSPAGLKAVERVVDVSVNGRAPKQHATLFALAVFASSSLTEVRQKALANVSAVCRTGTMLYEFVEYLEQFRGSGGRAVKRALASWYTDRSDESLALQLIKYRQREGWSHRDVLRLAHPKAETPERAALYDFACGRVGEAQHPMVRAYRHLQDTNVHGALEILREAYLPWEALPDRLMNEPKIWEQLIGEGNIGQTALIRQLPRLTRIGLLEPFSEFSRKVADLIVNEDRLKAGRVHPINVLIAHATYASGHGDRGKSVWRPNPLIVDALDAAFYGAFGNVVPANKRTLIALDVSPSMFGGQVVGSPSLVPATAAAAMSLIVAATEPQWALMGFTHTLSPIQISPRMRLDDVLRKTRNVHGWGGTDCSQPMLFAAANKLPVDTFIVYTDNETHSGTVKPYQALRAYRQETGIPARLVVQAFTATRFTIADPTDNGMLDVVGLDAAAPNVVSAFSRRDF